MFQCFIKISAAYGSTKDISVYSVLGLPPSQIFIVGRATKKYQTQCQVGGSWAGAGDWGKGRRGEGGSFLYCFTPSFAHLFIHSTNTAVHLPRTRLLVGAGESS